MPIIGPQVYPGGWKVIDREEAEVLLALQIPVRGWYFSAYGDCWWPYKGSPWSARRVSQSPATTYFVRESSDDG